MLRRKQSKQIPHGLPLEVQEIVLDQLSGDVQSLRNCSLVCRSWLPRSIFHLLRAVHIETGAQLDAFCDYLDSHPQRRPLVHSVTMAPILPKEHASLLGTFSSQLLTGLPSLRKWVVRGAGDGHRTQSRKLSFHRVTLIQLRYTSVEELHLFRVEVSSDMELIRLLTSLSCLRHLHYADVRLGKRLRGLTSPKLAVRKLHSLSSMDVSLSLSFILHLQNGVV